MDNRGGELIVVGCGTVVPEPDRGSSAYFVSLDGSQVMFDCGPGAVQGLTRLGLPWAAISDLVITHFHTDHVGALPGLFFALKHGLQYPREERLTVWGPRGTVSFFECMAAAFGDFIIHPNFAMEIHELEPDGEGVLSGGARLRAHKTPHTKESLAYRLDGEAGSFGYTGDSGPTDALGPFMSKVDVLLCECSLRDEEMNYSHLSPTSVATIANAAHPGKLILTHMYPHLRLGVDVVSLVAAAGYDGYVELAEEGFRAMLTNTNPA
jgi:ribonuclease BN (tRNA processing enzyme)